MTWSSCYASHTMTGAAWNKSGWIILLSYIFRARPLMAPRSHQSFCPVLAVKLLGIMLRNRCWPTTFHIITVEDADGMVLELTGVISLSPYIRMCMCIYIYIYICIYIRDADADAGKCPAQPGITQMWMEKFPGGAELPAFPRFYVGSLLLAEEKIKQL